MEEGEVDDVLNNEVDEDLVESDEEEDEDEEEDDDEMDVDELQNGSKKKSMKRAKPATGAGKRGEPEAKRVKVKNEMKEVVFDMKKTGSLLSEIGISEVFTSDK